MKVERRRACPGTACLKQASQGNFPGRRDVKGRFFAFFDDRLNPPPILASQMIGQIVHFSGTGALRVAFLIRVFTTLRNRLKNPTPRKPAWMLEPCLRL